MKAINIKYIISVELVEEFKCMSAKDFPFDKYEKSTLIIETLSKVHHVEFKNRKEAITSYNEILKNINYV